MNAVLYLRVSSAGQLDGFGLDAQEKACRAYAKAHGMRVVATFRDEGVSGTLDAAQRDGLMSALARLQDGDADALLVARLDRLARTLTAQEAVLAQVWKHNRALHSTDVGEVLVRRNMTHTSKGYMVGTPKTARAVRDVPIVDETLFRDLGKYLRDHPHRDNLEGGLWPGKVPGHNMLSYERDFDPKGFYRYTFEPAAIRAGLDGLHFHELRHTFATLALESRALDMHELSRAMGHASYAITDKVHAHVRPRDFSTHRAALSAHISAASAPVAPLRQIGG